MYERIYTVGCFDFFHQGHINLFKQMRKLGYQIIAGIHDDNSLEKLKNLKPENHQPLETRLKNVRKYSDQVFVIPGTDPTLYLDLMILDHETSQTACFVRADDLPNFPGRKLVETKIAIQLIPYTSGISSTQIRKKIEQEKNEKS